MKQDKQPGRKRKNWLLILVVVVVVLLYAYAIQVTKVNLEEPLDPNRQKELSSLIRDLAHPDLFTYDSETRTTNISIRMPCPEDVRASEVAGEGRVLQLDPNCASTAQDLVSARGTGFTPGVDGVILWFPVSQSTFHIERSEDGENWSEIDSISASGTDYLDSDLECDKEYLYRLRTFRAIDDQFSPYSDIVSDRTDVCGFSEPFGLSAAGQSQDSIRLTWQGIPQENSEAVIERSTTDDIWTEIGRVPSGTVEYVDEGLSCSEAYNYRVRYFRDDNGQYSAFSGIARDNPDPCEKAPPGDLTLVAISQSQIDLEWADNQENESAYLIERSLDGIIWSEITSIPADFTNYSDSTVGCETVFFYRVRGFQDIDGLHSQYSDVLSDVTGQCGLPAATDLSGAAVSQFQADMSWQDHTGGEAEYSVERSTESDSWTEIGLPRFGSNSFEDDNLICGNVYNYRVRAIQSDGRLLSPYSNEITVDAFACTKESPFDVVASSVSQSEIDLSWQDVTIIETISREIAEFKTDGAGDFEVAFSMPDIREHEEPQRLAFVEIISRDLSGLSDTTSETFGLIIVTILMALMASTLGSILAIPLSFLGARNLMADVGSPPAALMAAIIALPIGAFLGLFVGRQVSSLVDQITENLWMGLIALAIVVSVAWSIISFAMPRSTKRSARTTPVSTVLTLIVILLFIIGIGLLAVLGMSTGDWLRENLGIFGFIGNFIAILSQLARVLLAIIVASISGLVAASYASRYGQEAVLRMREGPGRILTGALTAIGTTLFTFGFLYALNWICLLGLCRQLPTEQPKLLLTLGLVSVSAGIITGLLALRTNPKRLFPIGMVTYSITRTFLNTLRAIEPVILGFVLVVWVGIGPFAGIMALMLNSIADLGKLFSEQVENISEGPVEAVTATGASRIQVIVYAVVPQVVPHFVAFIFYRWDINVRLSTIIGFVGGGGIGRVLIRYTNQTLYEKAAVMIIAIAVVVTILDNISSRVRKRII